jgi:LPXTG-motif cell wall-anchored protein
VPAKDIPLPAKMKAPKGTPTEEASVVWHQLLVARHLLHVSGNTSAPVAGTPRRPLPASPVVVTAGGKPPVRIGAISATAGSVRGSRSTTQWVGGGVAGLLALLSAGAFTFRRRRRAADETPS